MVSHFRKLTSNLVSPFSPFLEWLLTPHDKTFAHDIYIAASGVDGIEFDPDEIYYINMFKVIGETGWTIEEYEEADIETMRYFVAYLNGRDRAEQRATK